MIEDALKLAERGMFVFPVWWPVEGHCACGDPDCTAPAKHPVAWLVSKGKSDATRDAAVIRSWWGRAPNANIGVSTAPSGLALLDVDVSKGKQGWASLAQIDDQLPDTLQSETGSGGRHAYYLRGDVEPFQRIGAMPGIDIIANGYVIAPPSLHVSGKRYTWLNQVPIAPMPSVMVSLRKVANEISHDQVGTPIETGYRNNALFRLGAALRNSGIGRDALRAALTFENLQRFKPPLEESEVNAITHSVMTRVHPERDAALGAVVAEEMKEMFGIQEQDDPVAPVAVAQDLIGDLVKNSKLPVAHLPFVQLDEKLGGLAQHSTTVVIAGTGKGKTSFALQIGANHAENHGPVIYYVGEMTRSHILARIIGQRLNRSWLDVLRGGVPESDMRNTLMGVPIYLVKRSDNAVHSIAEACQKAVADGHTQMPMVIVDYVQLLAGIAADMRISTMQAVRDLQTLTENAPVVTVVLSQASRQGASRIRAGAGDAEELGDTGAETAELERGATNQLVLSFQSKDDVQIHEVTLMITKSRFGGGSKLGFEFNGRTGLWSPMKAPPVNRAHEQRCLDILTVMAAHEARKCVKGETSCGKELTTNALCESNGFHKVSGSKDAILEAVATLVELRKIVKFGAALMLHKE